MTSMPEEEKEKELKEEMKECVPGRGVVSGVLDVNHWCHSRGY